jgi:2-polyprenyl-3-methyl-5-hydroxy-6-metoxy-1,4-benzoquinol methylase
MSAERNAAIDVLRHNAGFVDPEPWADYAIRHQFKAVDSTPVPRCPDCGGAPRKTIGQYIYYSTLIHLVECEACGLIWSDVHLDARTIHGHFETAYKDEEYFSISRRAIFHDMVAQINRLVPPGGAVLDVGGAAGHLMHLLTGARPDVRAVVHDLSERATRFARERFGLATLCGDLEALRSAGLKFDVVVLSDVLYYEPRLREFWSLLPSLLTPAGSVVIRVPNKLLLIRAAQLASRFNSWRAKGHLQDAVKYFNPEHIYVLSRRYLVARLASIGFTSVTVRASPPLSSSSPLLRGTREVLFHLAGALNRVSIGRLVLTPSMVVIGRRVSAGP